MKTKLKQNTSSRAIAEGNDDNTATRANNETNIATTESFDNRFRETIMTVVLQGTLKQKNVNKNLKEFQVIIITSVNTRIITQ